MHHLNLAVYVGRPWTELDYLEAMTTSAPIYAQLKNDFPEVQAVNALYTHGLVVVVSTKTRYGGFARAIGMRLLTTTRGLGYASIVIVVDEDVDAFDLATRQTTMARSREPTALAGGTVGRTHLARPWHRLPPERRFFALLGRESCVASLAEQPSPRVSTAAR